MMRFSFSIDENGSECIYLVQDQLSISSSNLSSFTQMDHLSTILLYKQINKNKDLLWNDALNNSQIKTIDIYFKGLGLPVIFNSKYSNTFGSNLNYSKVHDISKIVSTHVGRGLLFNLDHFKSSNLRQSELLMKFNKMSYADLISKYNSYYSKIVENYEKLKSINRLLNEYNCDKKSNFYNGINFHHDNQCTDLLNITDMEKIYSLSNQASLVLGHIEVTPRKKLIHQFARSANLMLNSQAKSCYASKYIFNREMYKEQMTKYKYIEKKEKEFSSIKRENHHCGNFTTKGIYYSQKGTDERNLSKRKLIKENQPAFQNTAAVPYNPPGPKYYGEDYPLDVEHTNDCSSTIAGILARAGYKWYESQSEKYERISTYDLYKKVINNKNNKCFERRDFSKSSLAAGDIINYNRSRASSTQNGHIIMITSAGEDPFGIEKIKKADDLNCEDIDPMDFDFTFVHSAPSKSTALPGNKYLGRNSGVIKGSAETVPSLMRNRLVEIARKKCYGTLPSFNKDKNHAYSGDGRPVNIIRPTNHATCFQEPIKYKNEQCIEGCT